MKSLVIAACAMLVGGTAASAHRASVSYSETREINLPFSGAFDAVTNGVGGITVQAWENDYIYVRANVHTNARTDFEARQIAGRVEIEATSTRLRVSGPSGQSWAVSYDIRVPKTAALRLRTRVGALEVAEVAGEIDGETAVGAIELTRVSGPVSAKTEIGAIRIKTPPAGASIDLRTEMGNIKTDLPGARVEQTGFFSRKLVIEGEGPKVRAETSMGAIDLIL